MVHAFVLLALTQSVDLSDQLDSLYLKRDDPAALAEAERIVDQILAQPESDYRSVWRAARHEVWLADGSLGDAKKAAANKARELGERAMKLRPEAVEGNYYAAAGIGLVGQAGGILNAISEGVDRKFNERLDRALAIDARFDRGGGLLAKGRYFYEVPFFMRDLKKSAELYRRVLQSFPQSLRAHYYLGQTLIKDGKAEEGKRELQQAIDGDESYDPPEAKRVKVLAKAAKAEL